MLLELLLLGGGLLAVGLGNSVTKNENVRNTFDNFRDHAQRQTDQKIRNLDYAHDRGRISDEQYEARRSQLDDLRRKL